MSGPKDYVAPPRYSMHVFDGKLNIVFKLQAKLRSLIENCKAFAIHDEKYALAINAQADLKKAEAQNTIALESMVFKYKGSFGQEAYNRIENEIDKRISLLQKQISAMQDVVEKNSALEADYEAYTAYVSYCENTALTFEAYKAQILKYMADNLHASAPELLVDTSLKIENVVLDSHEENFKSGFQKEAEPLKNKLRDDVSIKESAISTIRMEAGREVLKMHKSKPKNKQTEASELSADAETLADIQRLEGRILGLIKACDNAERRHNYLEKLAKIRSLSSLQTVFHYKDLHDTILESEKLFAVRKQAKGLLNKMQKTILHQSLEKERRKLVGDCLKLIDAVKIRGGFIEALLNEFECLKAESAALAEADAIKEKENQFLKAQIIASLENMGYEVMDDMEVIDFEKEDEFLLKIRNQDNYLNLKFREDGSFRYVFQIPENKDALSVDMQNSKLHDMHVTCEEFQGVLAELRQMGLNVDMRSAKPVAVSSIISVSDKNKSKIRQKKKTVAGEKTQKKRYLDG